MAGAKDTARAASVRQPEDSLSAEQLKDNQCFGSEIGAMKKPGLQDEHAPTAAPREPLQSSTPTDVPDKASLSPSGPAHVAALKAEPGAVSRKEARSLQGGSPMAAAQTTSKSAYYSTFAAIKNFLQSLARCGQAKQLLWTHVVFYCTDETVWATTCSWRSSADSGSSEVLKRSLSELSAFRLPNQTNRLALIFDPLGHNVRVIAATECYLWLLQR